MNKDVNIFSLHARIRRKAECHDAEIERRETMKVLREQLKSSPFVTPSLSAPPMSNSLTLFCCTLLSMRLLLCLGHRIYEEVLLLFPHSFSLTTNEDYLRNPLPGWMHIARRLV